MQPVPSPHTNHWRVPFPPTPSHHSEPPGDWPTYLLATAEPNSPGPGRWLKTTRASTSNSGCEKRSSSPRSIRPPPLVHIAVPQAPAQGVRLPSGAPQKPPSSKLQIRSEAHTDVTHWV